MPLHFFFLGEHGDQCSEIFPVPTHYPYPNRISSVITATIEKANSCNSIPLSRSTCQLLGDGDSALAIDGDGEPVGVNGLFIIEHHDLGVAKPL